MYGSTRFAIYDGLKGYYKQSARKEAPLIVNIGAASVAGFVGGIVGNPADLANVRMQSDSLLPPHARRNYKSVIGAFVHFGQEEGWRGFARGVWINAGRASLVTASQLASYDAFKKLLVEGWKFKDDLGTHFSASILAGLVATTICNPLDVMKTQIMSRSQPMSISQAARGLWKAERLRWLYRGWTPSFIRIGPHTVATFIFLEQHRKLYRQFKTWRKD